MRMANSRRERVKLTNLHLSATSRSTSRVLRYARNAADVRIAHLGNRQNLPISADGNQEILPMHRPIIKQPLNLEEAELAGYSS